ncbi:BMP family protein [Piscinibacter gummiphilus]|uniref:BMP family ABC transporter substrate-binding protein n=1 Tax=Piscinibacter gummiphilus TaxID=946333 RepID=A0A1W6L463_9BURK|nr:BMP family protein [Piscinibacter gummiphilus]ARN19109.1 BMP family ABC transporter substrate-binding protein [Piscinibacter gummiphilus]ATU63762.1 BMP family ABC transporter substrate-binding protein [Piscinibacter gummiphilus]GLS93302.1 BMP family ABC transporter substrate-binding protein [Piscinibacter gummiphilus]
MLSSSTSRRSFSLRALLAAGLVAVPFAAFSADATRIGILIPGSKSDKGWMESGYDGLVAAQKKHGDKIKVQMIENINYADMEQALTNLASKNQLVIGVGGQTQAALLKVSKRFPKTKFSIVGGSKGDELPNVAGYDVKQAEIAFVAGATAAMLSKTGAVSYVGGMEIPSIVNAGKEFGKGAAYINPKIKYVENYTGNFDDVAKSKEATLAAIAQGADVHYHILNLGLRGMEQAAKEKGTHIIGSYTDRCGSDPLYIAYSITGVGYQVEYAIDEAVAGTWKAGYKPFGLAMGSKASDMSACGATPAMKAKIDEIKKDIQSGKIKVLEG